MLSPVILCWGRSPPYASWLYPFHRSPELYHHRFILPTLWQRLCHPGPNCPLDSASILWELWKLSSDCVSEQLPSSHLFSSSRALLKILLMPWGGNWYRILITCAWVRFLFGPSSPGYLDTSLIPWNEMMMMTTITIYPFWDLVSKNVGFLWVSLPFPEEILFICLPLSDLCIY